MNFKDTIYKLYFISTGLLKSFVIITLTNIVLGGGNLVLHAQVIKRNTASTSDSASSSNVVIRSDSSKNLLNYIISKDAIKQQISYEVPDSIILDNKSKSTVFYGKNVKIKSDDISIVAPKIIYNQDSNTLYAYEIADTLVKSEKASFTQGAETFYFDEIKYNFESQRALIENAKSKYDEGYIHSERIKRNPDQSIYGLNNIYTTCSFDHPHFAIKTNRIKIIPDKLVVTGPARLELADIPTPIILPFAMFPLRSGQKSGFILPMYDFSEVNGIGLNGLGYYLAINENMDFKLTGRIYSYGTWSLNGSTQYLKRYRYNGNFSLSYGSNVNGLKTDVNYSEQKSFSVNWTHSVNPKLLRNYNFSANVNYMSSNFYRNNTYNNYLFVQNSTNSTISLSKSWDGTPINFSLNLRHSQNNSTKAVSLTLPSLNFNVNQIFPFKNKISSVNQKWYEQIGISYSLVAENAINYSDTAFKISNPNTYQIQNGFSHRIPITASYKVFNYLNFNNQLNYNEYWNTKKSTFNYNRSAKKIDTTTQSGLFASRDFTFSTGFSTTLYGLFKFKKGTISAIRHQMIPSVGFSYSPDFSTPNWGNYYKYVSDSLGNETQASHFANSIIGFGQMGKSGSIFFNLNNNFQMKLKSKKDSSGYVKSRLIDALNFGISYNLMADSFQLSPLNISYSTMILNQISVQGGLSYSPYGYDSQTGLLSKKYIWENNRQLLRFTSFTLNISGGINSTMFTEDKNKKAQKANITNSDYMSNYIDFDIPWSLNLTLSNSINKNYIASKRKDTLQYTANAMVRGDFNLSPRWKFDFNVSYDFMTNKLNYTEFNIYRDLHCWELKIGTVPFGFHKSYNLTLNVKASILQDLRLTKRRDFIDNF